METNEKEIPKPEGIDAFIAIMGQRGKEYGLQLVRELRSKGLRTEIDLLARNFKGQFKYANRLNAKYTIVIGDNELDKGIVLIKDMETSTQRDVKLENIYMELIK